MALIPANSLFSRRSLFSGIAVCTALMVGAAADAPAQESGSVPADQYQKVVDAGIEFLLARAESEGGSLSGQSGTGITSLCVRSILEHRPSAVDNPALQQMLMYLESNVHEDGGIYTTGSRHRNYETCLAATALQAANRNGKYDQTLERAEAFLKGVQWDGDEGLESADPAYGGAGYGSHQRPDLSNTAFMIETLRDLGVDEDDEAIQKALIFVSRTQNLESPANDTPHAAKVNDGGFYYTPAAGGESQAGKTADGGLRSYGSMTYAGLKSMIFAGVEKDDPRVKAAMDFIRSHYTLEQNPGMGAAGLYYYYHTFAKALDVADVDTLTDAQGESHPWRAELFTELAEQQSEDGSWVNDENSRWLEGDRALVTGYALAALQYCQPTDK